MVTHDNIIMGVYMHLVMPVCRDTMFRRCVSLVIHRGIAVGVVAFYIVVVNGGEGTVTHYHTLNCVSCDRCCLWWCVHGCSYRH